MARRLNLRGGAGFTAMLLVTTMMGSPVWAEAVAAAEAPTQVATADDNDGNIVVTARRHAESIQTVPLTINAITGQQLANAGARNISDIAFLTPGLIINSGTGETSTSPVIRGLVSLGGTTDPTVATFFDGAYVSSTNANSVAMLDLDRVEVVKGPVNSLYGRSAYAGAINYVSKVPTDAFDLRASSTVGNDGQRVFKGVIGGAIIPGLLKARFAGGYDAYDGGYTDQVNGLKAGGYDKLDFQGSVAFTPADNFSMVGRLYYGKDSFGPGALGYVDNNCGASSTYAGVTRQQYYCGEYNQSQHSVEVAPQSVKFKANDRRVWNGYLKTEYQAHVFDVTALTTYTKVTQTRFTDFIGKRDGIPFNLNPGPGTVYLFQGFGSNGNVKDFSQELRFSAKPGSRLNWNFGGYYAHSTNYDTTLIGLDSNVLPAGQTIKGAPATVAYNYDTAFLTPGGVVSSAVTAARTKAQLWSAFAGTDYTLFDKLTLTGEARYTSDQRTLDSIASNLSAYAGVYRPFGGPFRATFTNWTGRLSARYQITPSKMVYATYANGVKSGGFNQRATLASERAYQPEKNKTWEIGTKTSWFDNRLRFNVSAFYIKLNGLQYSAPSDDPTNAGLVTKNIGGATSKGFEMELDANPFHGVNVGGSVSYTDSTINGGTYDFSNVAKCLAVGATYCDPSRITTVKTAQGSRTAVDLGGLQTPRQPAWTATAQAGYQGRLKEGWEWFLRAQYRYQSKQYAEPLGTYWWGSTSEVNAQIGVETGPIKATLFVQNLTKNTTPSYVYQSTELNDFGYIFNASMPYPRRYGITIDYKY